MHSSHPATQPARAKRATSGSITSLRTPRRRSDDQRINLRRSYQALMRRLAAGEPASSAYRPWPVRPYAASV